MEMNTIARMLWIGMQNVPGSNQTYAEMSKMSEVYGFACHLGSPKRPLDVFAAILRHARLLHFYLTRLSGTKTTPDLLKAGTNCVRFFAVLSTKPPPPPPAPPSPPLRHFPYAKNYVTTLSVYAAAKWAQIDGKEWIYTYIVNESIKDLVLPILPYFFSLSLSLSLDINICYPAHIRRLRNSAKPRAKWSSWNCCLHFCAILMDAEIVFARMEMVRIVWF